MACALLLVLTFAAAASASNYVEYSGAKMPQYGSAADYEMGRDHPPPHTSDDYHGQSPDAPASSDYKYEEEPRVKTELPTKVADDLDVWRKPGRKQRELVRSAESKNNLRNKYDHDEDKIPKFRTNHRYPKHRSRLKNEIDQSEEAMPPRRHSKYSRDRKQDSDIDREDYFKIDKDYNPDDKNKEFDDDNKFMREVSTKRSKRRKPRDRQFKRQRTLGLDDYEEDVEASMLMKSDLEKEEKVHPHFDDEMPRQRTSEERVTTERVNQRPIVDEEEEMNEVRKPKPKGYEDYDDYYDMQRVNNIKKKLPSLLRRTTVRMMSKKTTSTLLRMLLTNRRMMASSKPTESPTRASTQNLTSTTTATTSTVVVNVTVSTLNKTAVNISRELSLAEKSRLSILKKAQRKEGISFHSTKKPPVLLQVTSHMPTVVMVEPPSSSVPWMRAREFAEDSPARIELVKRLMRHKLVAEAKSIHDLTDNWDDMVCDYIDTSLLENSAEVLNAAKCLYMFCLQLCVWLINL